MKYVMLLLVVGGFASGAFWYVTENAKAERAEAYRREQARIAREEAEQEKQRIEDARIRKERAEALAKDDAVKLFLRYLDREENRLKTSVEESKLKLGKLHLDQRSLSDELIAIERANALRVESAKKRGEKQRDKVERVLAILKSPIMNRLAETYCGENFAALRSEYQGEMQKIKDVDDTYVKRLAANRKQYDADVKDADAEVDNKIRIASDKLKKAQKSNAESIPALRKRLENLQKPLAALEAKEAKSQHGGGKLTPWEKRDLERMQSQRALIEEQLSARENVSELGEANAAHVEATIAEARARAKYDSAAVRLRDADTVTLTERDHEQDVYNLASRYEIRSLDVIRAAMSRYAGQLEAEIEACQKKIAYLQESSANMDFLNAKEVESMRRQVAQRLAENTGKILGVGK